MPAKVEPKLSLGDTFGKLTYLGRSKKKRSNGAYCFSWVLCDCGDIKEVRTDNLFRGKSKSCGCSREIEKSFVQPNQKYGYLTAIKRLPGRRHNRSYPYLYWLCRCDCGVLVEVPYAKIKDTCDRGFSFNLHCGGPEHKDRLKYPPTEEPYPEEAAKIASEYLSMLRRFEDKGFQYDIAHSEFMRACYIIYWRQRYTSNPIKNKAAYLRKCLRYIDIAEVRQKRSEKGIVLRSRRYPTSAAKIVPQATPNPPKATVTEFSNPGPKPKRLSFNRR